MKYNLFTITLALLFMPGILAAQGENNVQQLSWSQVRKEALQNNPDILRQRNATQQSENNRTLGYSYLLPTVSASAYVGKSWKNDLIEAPSVNPASGDYDADVQEAKLSVSWTLFDGLRMFKALKLVNQQGDLSLVQKKYQELNTELAALQAYYNLRLQQETLRLSEEQVKISEQRVERLQARADMGRAFKRELLSAKIALQSDRSDLSSARHKLLTAQQDLSLVLGQELNANLFAADSIPVAPKEMNYEEWKDQVFQNNLNLAMLKEQKQIAESNVGLKASALWPMLIAQGSYGYSNSVAHYAAIDGEQEALNGQVGLSLQWNLFNGLADKTSLDNARLDLQNAEISLAQSRKQIEAQLQQQWNAFALAHEQLAANEEAANLAQQNLEVSEELYNLGKLSDVQFREAQLAWRAARIRVLGGRLQTLLTSSILKSLIAAPLLR
jgi:outer membrane protein TolC